MLLKLLRIAENKKYKQINEEGFVADGKIIELLKHIRDELSEPLVCR